MKKTKKEFKGMLSPYDSDDELLKELLEVEEGEDLTEALSDAFLDSDYILQEGEALLVIEVDGYLIFRESYDSLDEDDIKKLGRFYFDDSSLKEFEEVSTWSDDIEKSKFRMNESKLAIKYRGGEGYHYGWWILSA